jgi:predicted nucleic acid-binding protein
MTILIDTNILVAAVTPNDVHHREATQVLAALRNEEQIVSAPVLSELFYFVSKELSYRRAIISFTRVRMSFQIEALSLPDMERMEQIMKQYESAEFDFADTAIMAQAERLNITRIATFDHRDFEIFRPTHCEYLELLP